MGLVRCSAFIFSGLLLAALYGCASLEPEAEADWQSGAQIGPLADTDARGDGSRVVIGNPRSVAILDGADGMAVGAVGEQDILDALQVTVTVRHTPLAYKLRPESSNILMLDEADLLLVLDYEGARERVTAMDLTSGEQRWQLGGLDYSIQQYEATIRRAASQVGHEIASALGGQARAEPIARRRARQRHFAQGLAAPVDGGEAIVFKAFDGLVKLDASTGRELWRVDAFNGPGIVDLKELGNGDYLVLSRGRDLDRLQAANAYDLARIGPDGRLRWVARHAGRHTRGMQVAGDRVLVQGEPVEVFDLADGDKRWSAPEGWAAGNAGNDPRFMPEPDALITDTAVYQASPTHGEDGGFVTTGFPHQVRSFDPATGDERWATEVTDTYFGALHDVAGQLIVWGSGAFFNDAGSGGAAGLDRDTGEILWRTPVMEKPGMMSRAPRVVEPVYDAGREHLFVAGPENLYGIRLADGARVMHVPLADTELGSTMGLVSHDGAVVVVGQDGVASFSMDEGRKRFEVPTERVADFERYGDRLALEVSAGGLAAYQTDGPSQRGLVGLDLNDGSLGELIVWESSTSLLFGVLADGQAFITEDGRHAFIADEDGRLTRHSL